MEVITLLLLIGAGLVQCQTKTTEVDQANQKTFLEVLLIGVILLLVLNLFEARKREDEPAKSQNSEVEMPNKRVQPVKCLGSEADKTQGESLTNRLTSFTHSLRNIPQNMRSFSQSMRALYAETALGTTSETAKNLNKIRNETRRYALVYVKGILPVNITVVRSFQELFDQYDSLDFNDWIEYLPSILEDVRGYRQCGETLVTLHKDIMVPLIKKQEEARVLISKLRCHTEKLETVKRELEDSAEDHEFKMFICSLCGVQNYTPRQIVEEVAGAQQSKINKSAITLLSETMMPAISSFVDGFNDAAGFFKAVEDDIASIESTKIEMELKHKLHYNMMKKQAAEVKANCREFFCMIPEIESDFKAIPEMPDDRNYVERWLQKQQEHIAKTYSAKITGQLQNLLSCLKTTNKCRTAIKEKKET